jgi:hypothetical protein
MKGTTQTRAPRPHEDGNLLGNTLNVIGNIVKTCCIVQHTRTLLDWAGSAKRLSPPPCYRAAIPQIVWYHKPRARDTMISRLGNCMDDSLLESRLQDQKLTLWTLISFSLMQIDVLVATTKVGPTSREPKQHRRDALPDASARELIPLYGIEFLSAPIALLMCLSS